MWNWLKILFNKLIKVFNGFLKELFDAGLKVLLASLYDVALESVKRLADTDLANEQKRQQAFNEIKEYAIKEGISVSNHLINLLIEMCVAYIKKIEV